MADAAAGQQQDKGQTIMQIVKYASGAVAALIFVAFAGLSLRKVLRQYQKKGKAAAR